MPFFCTASQGIVAWNVPRRFFIFSLFQSPLLDLYFSSSFARSSAVHHTGMGCRTWTSLTLGLQSRLPPALPGSSPAGGTSTAGVAGPPFFERLAAAKVFWVSGVAITSSSATLGSAAKALPNASLAPFWSFFPPRTMPTYIQALATTGGLHWPLHAPIAATKSDSARSYLAAM